jgi:hypothetical protein
MKIERHVTQQSLVIYLFSKALILMFTKNNLITFFESFMNQINSSNILNYLYEGCISISSKCCNDWVQYKFN